MTEQNRAQNIADELRRAAQALQAAEALVGLGPHADSVSRAYYGVFHITGRCCSREGLSRALTLARFIC